MNYTIVTICLILDRIRESALSPIVDINDFTVLFDKSSKLLDHVGNTVFFLFIKSRTDDEEYFIL